DISGSRPDGYYLIVHVMKGPDGQVGMSDTFRIRRVGPNGAADRHDGRQASAMVRRILPGGATAHTQSYHINAMLVDPVMFQRIVHHRFHVFWLRPYFELRADHHKGK